jgi:hypothetical protein
MQALRSRVFALPSYAAFLGWRERADSGRTPASAAFLIFGAAAGFVNSPKLGQIVARPQWTQSGFWE